MKTLCNDASQLRDIIVYYKTYKNDEINTLIISQPAWYPIIDVQDIEKTIAIALKDVKVRSCWF